VGRVHSTGSSPYQIGVVLTEEVSNLEQFCAWDARLVFLPSNQPWPTLEEVMENYADLMQRLLEIQSGERRSPKLIAEDERDARSEETAGRKAYTTVRA
jgi:hypothetical protein